MDTTLRLHLNEIAETLITGEVSIISPCLRDFFIVLPDPNGFTPKVELSLEGEAYYARLRRQEREGA